MGGWSLSRTRLRGEILAIQDITLKKRNELLSMRNVWKTRLQVLLLNAPTDTDLLQGIKQIAKFYFQISGKLKILFDIQTELQLLDSDLDHWPTLPLLKKARKFLNFLLVANTDSIEIFYLSRNSYFKTARLLIDTEWGIFSSLDKFYDFLITPPNYEDPKPPPYSECVIHAGTSD
jgi:hypothetical protein